MNQNTLQWKLFPFSLTERAKTWYYWTVVRVGGDWIQLKDEFCLFFFPVPKVIPCRIQLLTFEQGDNESLGAAWARFTHLATSSPPYKIDEEMLMQHFIYGLNPKSERFINLASEGSVMYKATAEVRTILEKVLNST